MTVAQVLQRETEQSTPSLHSGRGSGNKASLVKWTSLSGGMFKVAAKNDVYVFQRSGESTRVSHLGLRNGDKTKALLYVCP